MNLLIISDDEFRAAIKRVFSATRFPVYPRSPRVWIPSVQYFRDTWQPFWNEYRRARALEYIPKSGMCDVFAAGAAFEFDWTAAKTGQKHGLGDFSGGLIQAKVGISPGTNLNGIPGEIGRNHQTCLVGLTEDGKSWEPYFWEPQNDRSFQITRCAEVSPDRSFDDPAGSMDIVSLADALD